VPSEVVRAVFEGVSMTLVIGFAIGLAWGIGAMLTAVTTAWIGPLWLLIFTWPGVLVIEAFDYLRSK
jgi:hypothetical protein